MTVYEARHAGREYCCDTEGSDHYREGGVEPIDLMIAKGIIEDFCIGNMVKYATRFKLTRNLVDLKKVSDYAHILCGVELAKTATPAPTEDNNCYGATVALLGAEDKPSKYVELINKNPPHDSHLVRRDYLNKEEKE